MLSILLEDTGSITSYLRVIHGRQTPFMTSSLSTNQSKQNEATIISYTVLSETQTKSVLIAAGQSDADFRVDNYLISLEPS